MAKVIVRRWTALAKECFFNHYICSECKAVSDDLKPYCNVSDYAQASFLKFGAPLSNIDDIESREKMKEIKRKKNCTFDELAQEVGVSMPSLKNFCRGIKCSDRIVNKILKYLDESEGIC